MVVAAVVLLVLSLQGAVGVQLLQQVQGPRNPLVLLLSVGRWLVSYRSAAGVCTGLQL